MKKLLFIAVSKQDNLTKQAYQLGTYMAKHNYELVFGPVLLVLWELFKMAES